MPPTAMEAILRDIPEVVPVISRGVDRVSWYVERWLNRRYLMVVPEWEARTRPTQSSAV